MRDPGNILDSRFRGNDIEDIGYVEKIRKFLKNLFRRITMKMICRISGVVMLLFGLFIGYMDLYILNTAGIADTVFYFICKTLVLFDMPYPYVTALFLWVTPMLLGLLLIACPLDIGFREIIEIHNSQKSSQQIGLGKEKTMRKLLMVLVAIVVFAAVVSSEAATTFKCEAENTNPSSTMVVRGSRGPMGPQGPQGPAGQVPEWYLWLAIGALGLSLVALLVALTRPQAAAVAPAPVIVNNYPPAVGCPAARNVPNQL
jgi:hypothetical protein